MFMKTRARVVTFTEYPEPGQSRGLLESNCSYRFKKNTSFGGRHKDRGMDY